MTEVVWPVGDEPAGAALHETNLGTSTASPERVWAWLTHPETWGGFYGNAKRIRHISGPWPEFGLGSRFSWITFGAAVKSEVVEFVPHERLAWNAKGLGSHGHHAWVLSPRADGGCDIRTEETQRGPLMKVIGRALAPVMRRMHQRWVDGLARVAATGEPS